MKLQLNIMVHNIWFIKYRMNILHILDRDIDAFSHPIPDFQAF